jgi:hypothetical protein
MFELQSRDFIFAIIGSALIAFINDPIRELQALMSRTLFWIPFETRLEGVDRRNLKFTNLITHYKPGLALELNLSPK